MAEKHGQQDTLTGALPASYRLWADDPNIKTYQVHPDKLVSYANAARIKRLALSVFVLLADGATTWTRDAFGALTAATVRWDRVIDDAADGVFAGVPHGTFPSLLESYSVTYPDLSITVTVDRNIDAVTGLAGPATIGVT